MMYKVTKVNVPIFSKGQISKVNVGLSISGNDDRWSFYTIASE